MLKYFYSTAACMLFAVTLGVAQPGPPPGNPRNPRSPQIPIDGGIGFLVAAGAAYGARKLYLNNRKEEQV